MSHAIVMRPLPMTIMSGTNTVAGSDPAYVGNDHMGVVWRARSAASASQSLILDLGADVAADALALIGLTGAGAGWTLQVSAASAAQGPFGGARHDWPAVPLLAGALATRSGRGRAWWQAPAGGPAAARYWRITITTPAPDMTITVARVVIGQQIQPERNFQFGAAFGVRDTGAIDWSPRGVLLRRRGVKLRSIGLSFAALHQDEVKAHIHPLVERLGVTGPVLLVTDPDPDEDRQNRIYFGPMVGDIGTVWARANAGWQWQANVVDLESIVGDA